MLGAASLILRGWQAHYDAFDRRFVESGTGERFRLDGGRGTVPVSPEEAHALRSEAMERLKQADRWRFPLLFAWLPGTLPLALFGGMVLWMLGIGFLWPVMLIIWLVGVPALVALLPRLEATKIEQEAELRFADRIPTPDHVLPLREMVEPGLEIRQIVAGVALAVLLGLLIAMLTLPEAAGAKMRETLGPWVIQALQIVGAVMGVISLIGVFISGRRRQQRLDGSASRRLRARQGDPMSGRR